MRHTNLSGNITVKEQLKRKDFVERATNQPAIYAYALPEVVKPNKEKFKLGQDEYEFNVVVSLKERLVDVLVYLQLSTDGETVDVIETFTGTTELIDVNEYEDALFSFIKESVKGKFDFLLEFEGQSSGYK